MSIQRAAPVNELLAKLIFLILPTALVGYFLLYNANVYYAILQNDAVRQSFYFLGGMVLSAIFYAFRIRFLPTFLALIILLWLGQKGIDRLATGEFDAFFLIAQYRVFAILFGTGWLLGWGFLRIRFWAIIISSLLLMGCVAVIAKQQTETVNQLLWAFSPIVIYVVYIIYATEQINSYGDKSQRFWWFLIWRLGSFLALSFLLFAGVTWFMRGEIKETVANFGGGGKNGSNSMLKQNKDNTFDLKNYSRLQSSLSRNNELLFCAHIDNFFDDNDFLKSRGVEMNKGVANPLYLSAFYYTKFDTATETFERDSLLPFNDCFDPDPAAIPLFATRTDMSVVKNSMATKFVKEVSIEVYSRKLSPHTYLAPHTGFFVQPITVDKDFRDSFKYAFRAKSMVSELNSAYLIYNANNPDIRAFQENRFAELRTAPGYNGMDTRFMSYYTYMPSDTKFQNIRELAANVTRGKTTTIDKMLAIRDWFLSKDSTGTALFKYTDNPGIPDIPSASKLQYFLFENRKGYCAYFAGATLFMLRSLGVPSRIAVGFLTIDRSDKNKGWYWYYADQAHAWVQVFFPGYGWLDFDTTVGNDETHDSPKPDGTPPMQPPRAWLAIDGAVQSVDTAKKIMELNVHHVVFKDKEYDVSTTAPIKLDVHVATIRRDSADVPLYTVQKGDSATAVSYADAFRDLSEVSNEAGNNLLKRFPKPAPIDEVYLKHKAEKKKNDVPKKVEQEKPFSWRDLLVRTAIVISSLILLFFLVPSLIYTYYRLRYAVSKGDPKVYWAYRTAGFYLHQLGFRRGRRTPMQYAVAMDPMLNAGYVPFMNSYLKLKYAKQPLTDAERAKTNLFLGQFLKGVNRNTTFGRRLGGFLSPWRSFGYFMQQYNSSES